MSDKEKINLLIKQKSVVDKQIQEIQSGCKHTEKTLKAVEGEDNTVSIRWVCDDCQYILVTPPSHEEVKKWMSNDNS